MAATVETMLPKTRTMASFSYNGTNTYLTTQAKFYSEHMQLLAIEGIIEDVNDVSSSSSSTKSPSRSLDYLFFSKLPWSLDLLGYRK